ncbi:MULTISPECIES: ABC transporter ATP-binding protein [unclassified Isoptericola]|uniref:ABC transporter ATP-binding protein n=1 Tax=unclassified Isoptericola TaxID=2623355 RepID=UPI00365BF4EC
MTHEPRPPVLEVRDLVVEFSTRRGLVRAVDGVSFSLRHGEALGILGESGSGKSVTAGAVMGILESPPAHVRDGQVLLNGEDLLDMDPKDRRALMASTVSMVFQDALTALNPVHPVGRQIGELYRVHRGMSRRDARDRAVEMMRLVNIPDAERRVDDYPHQFSGGMRQRIMIALALALDPEVLIADEPTTALDVTVQAQILDLLGKQQRERDMGLVLITHDLAVASEVTDRVAVMYAGRIVESGTAAEVLTGPAHPYSRGLCDSVASAELKGSRLPAIPGQPPDLAAIPAGCAFAPRCARATDMCRHDRPSLLAVPGGHPGRQAACHYAEEAIHV